MPKAESNLKEGGVLHNPPQAEETPQPVRKPTPKDAAATPPAPQPPAPTDTDQ